MQDWKAYLPEVLLFFVPVSVIGAWVAKLFVDRVRQDHFRLAIALFLALVALRFLLFP